jgi:hypothetical protein
MANPLNISIQFDGTDQGAEALIARINKMLADLADKEAKAGQAMQQFGAGTKEANAAMLEASQFARQYANQLQEQARMARLASDAATKAATEQKLRSKQVVDAAKDNARQQVEAAKNIANQRTEAQKQVIRQNQEDLRAGKQAALETRRTAIQQVEAIRNRAQAVARSARQQLESNNQVVRNVLDGERRKIEALRTNDREQRAIERRALEDARRRVRETAATALRNPDSRNARFNVRLARESLTNLRDQISSERALRREQIEGARAHTRSVLEAGRQQVQANREVYRSTIQGLRDGIRAAVENARARIESSRQVVAALQQQVSASRGVLAQIISSNREQVQAARASAAAQVRAAQQAQQPLVNQARQAAQAARTTASIFTQAATQAGGAASRLVRAATTATGALQQMSNAQQIGASTASALTNRLIQLAATLAIADKIRDFIAAGIKFNETMQTVGIGIATLITAQTTLTDENGKLVEGTNALNRALVLSEGQLQKLRIAGIQTAATTQQLADAFQQAVGAGLSAGLNLDQIRQLTVQIVQAAGALGVPMHQLNQEVRSILEGTIDRNSRVAKALRITNQEIKSAAASGKLFETLFDRFEAFTVAGPKIQQTFTAMKSNLSEAVQVLAGAGTKQLFDNLTKLGNEAIAKIFDFETGNVTRAFQPVVAMIEDVMGRVGVLAGNALAGIVDGAESLAAMWERNKEEIDLVLDAVGDLASTLADTVLELLKLAGGFTKAVLESRALYATVKIIEGAFKAINILLEFMNQHLVATGLVLGGLTVLFGFPALIGAIAAAPFTSAIAGILALAGAIIALGDAAEDAERRMREAGAANVKADNEAAGLAAQYIALTKALENRKLKEEEIKRLQEERLQVEKKLKESGTGFAEVMNQEGKSSAQLAEDLDQLTRSRIAATASQLAKAEADLKAAEAARRQPSIREQAEKGDIEGLFNRKTATVPLEQARANVIRLRAQLRELNGEVINGRERVNALLTTVNTGQSLLANGAKEGLSTLKEQVQGEIDFIKESLKEIVAVQKFNLDAGVLTQRQFITSIRDFTEQAIDAQIKLKEKLLAATTDPSDREKILADIRQLESERRQAALDAGQKLLNETQNLHKTSRSLVVQELKNQGNDMAAAAFEAGEKYMDALTAAIDAGDEALRKRIQKLIDEDTRNATFSAIDKQAQVLQGQLQAKLEQIRLLQESGAIGSAEALRLQKAAYQELIDKLKQMALALQAIAVTPEQLLALAEFNNLILQLENNLKQTELTWNKFRDLVAESIADNLQTALSDIILGTKKVTDAFRDMAKGILEEITRIITRMLAIKIVEGILGVALPMGFATGGSFQDAPEGLISGPGGPKTDSILAKVSRDEYIVNADSTRKLGVDRLDYINRYGRLPRFAEGGLITADGLTGLAKAMRTPDVGSVEAGSFSAGTIAKAVQNQAASATLDGFLQLGLDEGFIIKKMNASFLKVSENHIRDLRQMVKG